MKHMPLGANGFHTPMVVRFVSGTAITMMSFYGKMMGKLCGLSVIIRVASDQQT